MPSEQQIHGPLLERPRLVTAFQHIAFPVSHLIFVARHHIEIRTGEIAFIFINRLKHRARIAGRGVFSQFTAVFAGISGAAHLAERIVATHAVHLTIGRIEVKQIGIHRRSIVEPTLGERVLAVVAVALVLIVAALVRAESEVAVGIHIPHFAVGTGVGAFECIPQAIIAHYRMVFGNDARKFALEGEAALSVCGFIITFGFAARGGGRRGMSAESQHIVAPNLLHQFGKVDKGIAVVLNRIDGIVAVHFLLAHRVLPMPFQEHGHRPILQGLRGSAVAHHTRFLTAFVIHGVPIGHFIFVACHHVEVGACQIALVFVYRFENLAFEARCGTRSEHAAIAAFESVFSLLHLAIGVVVADGVDTARNGIHVEEVVVFGFFLGFVSAEPRIGKGVFAVELIALIGGVGTIVGIEREIAVGIDVPRQRVVVEALVGGLKGLPKVIVFESRMVLDNVVEGGLELVTRFSYRRPIVGGVFSCSENRGDGKEQDRNQADAKKKCTCFHRIPLFKDVFRA